MKYIEIAKIFFKAQMAYRFDAFMAALFAISKILFAYVLWGAVFGQNETVAGFTFTQMLSYYIIHSFLSQINPSEGVGYEVGSHIRGGTFSKYMVVPIRINGWFVAKSFGVMAYTLMFAVVGTSLWMALFGTGYVLTLNFSTLALAFVMILLGLLFMIQLNYFIGLFAFKYQDINAFLMIKEELVTLITGGLVPLVLLPETIVSAMKYLPFYYVSYLPSMLLIGKNEEEAVRGVLLLLVWLVAFLFINRYAYEKMRVLYDGVGI